MSEALAIVRLLPDNKSQIESFIRVAKNEILSGEVNPLEIDIRLKIMEELIAGLRKDSDIKAAILNELDMYPEKTVAVYGAEITKRNYTKYDFSLCNDSELELLQAEADLANMKVKQRQEMLKVISPCSVVNPDTGEYLQPARKEVSETYAIKIK